jgi:hypothetical protein
MFCPRELGNCHRQPKALTSIRDFNALRSSNHVDGSTFPATGYTGFLEITSRNCPQSRVFGIPQPEAAGTSNLLKIPFLVSLDTGDFETEQIVPDKISL